ncbi:hypothetical protein SDRG_07428 [Saprolegnia diclina VS20]|uniref:Uncharacterized protein n=1 Tax=Saprolegnia diclina (strain VS20) TaxID=1156394 RepID=T0QBB9_SAPDV|nr:hypothetical protein SDRG_07428 [Saprolegnia diclina VS20]EQC35199.1 hypothetical protein SDRG_07428 [Saprolegnia diclina VS20]|eukprot:XP_008611483.1 hypothetical protein SDRG_07428 [Saprolegnia diclina VS20]
MLQATCVQLGGMSGSASGSKRRRDSARWHSMSSQPPSEKLRKRDEPLPVLDADVLTTAFEPTLLQSEAEALAIAAEMAADFYSEVSVLYNLVSDMRVLSDEAATMDVLMARLDAHVRDDDARDAEKVHNVYQGMLHVYVYLYRVHLRHFAQLEMSGHLTLCWRRLMAFASEYRVLDTTVLQKIYDFVMNLVGRPL